MTVTLYHEISPESLDLVQKEGIKRKSEGVKSDREKQKVDTFLDTHLPEWTAPQQVCRANVVYAYLPDGDSKIIDIKNGDAVPLELYMARSKQTLLAVNVDENACYVSDLDLYDTMTRALELDEQDSTREHLADRYWERVVTLRDYEPGMIARPEVMIAADIRPQDFEVVRPQEGV